MSARSLRVVGGDARSRASTARARSTNSVTGGGPRRALEARRCAVAGGVSERRPRRPARRGCAARCGSSPGSVAVGATVYSRTRTGAASTICSKLSSTISTRRSARARARCAPRARPRRCRGCRGCTAIVGQQQSGLEHVLEERRSTSRRGTIVARRAAISIARRLLPMPPGPMRLTTPVACLGRASVAHASMPSRSRPIGVGVGHRDARDGGSVPRARSRARRTPATRRSARPGAWRGRRRPESSQARRRVEVQVGDAVSSAWMRAMSSVRRSSRAAVLLRCRSAWASSRGARLYSSSSPEISSSGRDPAVARRRRCRRTRRSGRGTRGTARGAGGGGRPARTSPGPAAGARWPCLARTLVGASSRRVGADEHPDPLVGRA